MPQILSVNARFPHWGASSSAPRPSQSCDNLAHLSR